MILSSEFDKISGLLTTKISLRIETCCSQILKPLKPRERFFENWLSEVDSSGQTTTWKGKKSMRKTYALFETLEPLFNKVFSRILLPANLKDSGSYFHILKNVSIFVHRH